MKLVDVHCHLNHIKFKDDVGKVIENAKKAGVVKIIASGVNPPTNREILEIKQRYPDIIECSFGAYPVDALNVKTAALDEVGLRKTEHFDVDEELAWIKDNKDKCIAIGEIGLDYQYITDESLQKKSREIFQKIIDLCEKIKKPIIIHSRKAESDCVDMLISSNAKKVLLHCFNGRKSLIKKAADAGFSFSVPAVITRLQHFQTLTEMVNINQLLTETDAPWLSPIPGQRNEPANVNETIKQIAKIKNFTEEETANSIFKNYQELFA